MEGRTDEYGEAIEMAWARIATTNENFQPLIGVEVECFDVDTLAVISVVTSDLGGIALFTDLPDTQRFFFKVRARRTSTRVQSVLDPATGRTYTGQVRLQILDSHPGTNCYEYFVVPSGNFGTHKTIQAAINAAMVTTGIKRILVMAGTYTENLVIPATATGGNTLSTLFIEGCSPAHAAISAETPVVIPTNAAPVWVDGVSAAALTYGATAMGPATVIIGLGFKANFVGKVVDLNRGNLQLIRCVVSQGNTGGTGLDTGGTSTQICDSLVLEHCVVDGGVLAIRGHIGLRILNCQIGAPIQVANGSYTVEGMYIADSSFEGNNAGYVLDLQELSSLNPFRFVNNIVRQRNASGGGLIIGGLSDPLEGTVIVGNEFHGPGAGIAIRVGGPDFYFVTQAVIVGNAFWQWATGVSIHANSSAVVLGNSYSNVTTQIVGTPTVNPSEFGHVILGPAHTDTLAAAVLDGDTIIGNATPKWSRLAISIPAANVRNVLGIDNAELRPSWKTALDATDPANIAAAASAGTSLIFSHRDHVHAHPVFAGGDLHTEYLTQSEADLLYAPIGGAHAAVTLSATLDSNLLGLTGQQLTLDTQAANLIFAGPVSGAVAAPTFRSLVAADLGTGAPDGTKYLRDDLTWQAVAGGGAHALLSVTHSDTLADNVLDGDTIIGNATPKWSKLAISVPGAVALLNVLGIVTGETRPSWKALFDTTNPTTIGVSDVAAPGTQTIAAHRDHQHGSPATFPAVAHALLSATHSDILADSVLAGDVMIGNDTPKWSRLAISVPAANVRNVLGVDNGETTPSWKTALDDTHPADIAAAATEGTSLVFSHRDHVHAHPAIAGDLHTGYFLLAGRAGGQVAYGGTGAGDDLTLKSTSHGTKGSIFLDELDGLLVKGYTRVGSLTAPANVTAGDLTAVRLSIGNATLATGQVFYVYNASVANASATNALITASFTPTANGAYDMRGLEGQARYYGAFNNTSNLYGGAFSTSVGGTGKVNYLAAIAGFGLVLRTGAGAAMAVGDARCMSFQLVYGSGRAAGETATIDALTGVRIDHGYATLIAGDVVTNAYGIYMQNMGNAKVTNAYGIYIAGVSLAATLNIGIKLDGCTTATLWLNSDTAAEGVIAWGTARDTNLYRSAANVLKTDDSLHVAINALAVGYVRVGSLSVPTNVTAGDLTALRAIIGTDEALGASVLLDLNSVTGALLLSRMTTVQKAALTGVAGMVLYDSTLGQFHAYDGAWKQVILVGTPADYTVSNVTTDRTYDANATTIDEIADIVGTLISDLQSIGLLQ